MTQKQPREIFAQKLPRRRLDAGESARLAGQMMGRMVAVERRRNARRFAALWLAWAVTTALAVFG
jgi:hypothetical protein